jgi:hypothetical protein
MSIAELKIPDGEPLPTGSIVAMRAVAVELMIARTSELSLLGPGQYDITPDIWTKHLHNHELVVLDDGTGLYRMHPRHDDSGLAQVSPGGTRMKQGGQNTLIDRKNPLAIVAGGHPRKPDLQMFGLIAYLGE